jgi:adenylate cyclase
MGVGIHSGECVAGCVGPPTRQQYTVVGDTVNLAARMQALTKKFGVDVLVSEQVFKECGNWLLVRDLGRTPVEGRQTEVHVYQLLGTKHDRRESSDAVEREKERERKSAS